jgi:hypothetical protein
MVMNLGFNVVQKIDGERVVFSLICNIAQVQNLGNGGIMSCLQGVLNPNSRIFPVPLDHRFNYLPATN